MTRNCNMALSHSLPLHWDSTQSLDHSPNWSLVGRDAVGAEGSLGVFCMHSSSLISDPSCTGVFQLKALPTEVKGFWVLIYTYYIFSEINIKYGYIEIHNFSPNPMLEEWETQSSSSSRTSSTCLTITIDTITSDYQHLHQHYYSHDINMKLYLN